MKKFTPALLITLLMTSVTFADEPQLETTAIAAPVELVAENTQAQVQEKVVYNYYHSPACTWCQKLDKFLKKHDAYEKLEINKIDVRSRGVEMIQAAEEH
jgi:thioredoxin-related protein